MYPSIYLHNFIRLSYGFQYIFPAFRVVVIRLLFLLQLSHRIGFGTQQNYSSPISHLHTHIFSIRIYNNNVL